MTSAPSTTHCRFRMIDTKGNAVVLDFGIARSIDTQHFTQPGVTIGALAYMRSARCHGSVTSASSDQYSLGVFAYEMLTGTPPFTGSPIEGVLRLCTPALVVQYAGRCGRWRRVKAHTGRRLGDRRNGRDAALETQTHETHPGALQRPARGLAWTACVPYHRAPDRPAGAIWRLRCDGAWPLGEGAHPTKGA